LTLSQQRYSVKKIPKKLISRQNEKPNTLTWQENKDKIYVKNIRKEIISDPKPTET
jgi:hypothetical protein